MSIGSTQPFRPAGTVTLAAGTAAVVGTLPKSGEAVLVCNTTSSAAFIRFGTDTTVTASAADTPLPAGTRTLLHVGIASTVAVILASGSGTVYVTRGEGTVY